MPCYAHFFSPPVIIISPLISSPPSLLLLFFLFLLLLLLLPLLLLQESALLLSSLTIYLLHQRNACSTQKRHLIIPLFLSLSSLALFTDSLDACFQSPFVHPTNTGPTHALTNTLRINGTQHQRLDCNNDYRKTGKAVARSGSQRDGGFGQLDVDRTVRRQQRHREIRRQAE